MPRRVDLVTLVILDGFGCAPAGPGNAVELADTPVFDRLWAEAAPPRSIMTTAGTTKEARNRGLMT